MKDKGDSHETFSLLFKRYSVPPNMVMYGLKDQAIGSFRNNYQEADCHINQTEPYSPCNFQVEGTIRYMKKGSGSNMV